MRIWSWVRHIFPTYDFSNKDVFLYFIKSDGSPLVKLVKLAVITFSIWMIWRMRNYACFQDKIEVYRVILVIKDLTCLVDNSSKALMKNDMSISMCSSFLVLTLVLVKFYVLFLLVESFLHHTGLKLTLMRLLGVIQVLPLVEVFFVEYGEVYWSFLCVSWRSDCFGCWILWSYICFGESSKVGSY